MRIYIYILIFLYMFVLTQNIYRWCYIYEFWEKGERPRNSRKDWVAGPSGLRVGEIPELSFYEQRILNESSIGASTGL